MSRKKTVAKVLDLKRQRKEEAELEISRINAAVRDLQELIDRKEREFDAEMARFRSRQARKGVSSHELDLHYGFFTAATAEINDLRRRLKGLLERLDEAQNRLIEAFREERLFEIMQEKIVSDERREADRIAQREADYLHLSRGKGRA